MGKQQLTKMVPARRKTITFRWIGKLYSSTPVKFVEASKRLGKTMKCFWCGAELLAGDELWLGAREHKGNVKLCKACAAEANKENDNG